MFLAKKILLVLGIVTSFSFAYAGTPPGQGTSPIPAPDGGDSAFFNQDLTNAPGIPSIENKKYNKSDFDGTTGTAGTLALDGIKNIINRVLGLLALIALIILIYQGVIMLVNAKDSKKIDEGYTTVKNVAIALIFIGVSWLIVSFIFWAIGVFTGKS